MADVISPVRAKSQHAYRELKRRILTMDLAPGQLLHEAELIETLGFGRTPVREAIQRLAAEKLVIARPRQTAYVAPILARELTDVVEMRLILEVPAARMAAERGTSRDRSQLEAACETFRELAAASDKAGIVAADAAIHARIAAMSGNAFLTDYSDQLAVFNARIWWLSAQNAHEDDAFAHCHDELVRVVCARDVEAAGREAASHVGLFQARLGRLIGAVPAVAADIGRAPLQPTAAA